jgi:hypothetical protein
VNYNRVFGATVASSTGVNQYRNDAQVDYGTKAGEQIGIPGVNLDAWTSGWPQWISQVLKPRGRYSASLGSVETNFNLVNT